MGIIDISSYADSDQNAEERSIAYRSLDPYPSIASALLNSADIAAYVKATGMIYPFYPDDLKGATYDMKVKGPVVYWEYDEESQMPRVFKKDLKEKEDYFDLKPNSIAFVTLEPMIRVPNYIVLRFNLKVTHVYKGLLLGTGPIVDPGFVGKLSIPLHNLTSNVYRFHCDESMITVEFTKMSQYHAWSSEYRNEQVHSEKYVPKKFDDKNKRTVEDYIQRALKHDMNTSIVSSVPDAVNECKKSVKQAEENAKDARKEVESARNETESIRKEAKVQSAVSIIALATIVITAFGLCYESIRDANSRYDSLQLEMEEKVDNLSEQIRELQEEVRQLDSQNDPLMGGSDAAE